MELKNKEQKSKKKKLKSEVEKLLKENGIDLDKLDTAPVVNFKSLCTQEFTEIFHDVFYHQADMIMDEVFVKYKFKEETHSYFVENFKKIKSEFGIKASSPKELEEIIWNGARTLSKNKLNRERFLRNYLKEKNMTVSDEALSLLKDYLKDSLEVDEIDKCFYLWYEPYSVAAQKFTNELKTVFTDFNASFTETQLLNEDDTVEVDKTGESKLITKILANSSNVTMGISAGTEKFVLNKTFDLNNYDISDVFSGLILDNYIEKLEPSLEDNTFHMLGRFIKFIFSLSKHEVCSEYIMGNMLSLDDIQASCRDALIATLVSPLDILNSIILFGINNSINKVES